MSKILSIIIVIIVVIGAVWFYQNMSEKEALVPAPAANSSEVVKEVEGIDVGDLNSEFDQIDQDLNTL